MPVRAAAESRLPVLDRRRLVVCVALGVGLLLTELDQSVFAAALPTLVGELGGVDLQQWVGTGYLLAAVLPMPFVGRLGDLVGRRPVFVAALGLFVLGSLVGALAPSMPVLIAGRVLQGAGGGGLYLQVQAIVAEVVPPAPRTLVLSGIGVVFALAAVGGPVLGGWLTATVGWRWAFWLDVPLGLAAAVAAARLLPPPARRLRTVRRITHQTMTHRMSVLRVFSRPGFTPAVTGGAVLAVAMFGTVNYLPTYLQLVHGLDPVDSGLFLLTLVSGIGSATVVVGRVVARTGRAARFPLLGGLLVTAALVWAACWRVDTGLVETGCCLFVLGAGIGCAWEVLAVIAQDAAGADDLGTATAVNGFARELGVLAGTALVGTVFTGGLIGRLAVLPGLPDPLTPAAVAALPAAGRAGVAQAYHDAFVPAVAVLVPVVVAATVALARLPRRRLAGARREGTR